MTSKSVAILLVDLGVTKTHRRPHVSDENPFSEAQFQSSQLTVARTAWFDGLRVPTGWTDDTASAAQKRRTGNDYGIRWQGQAP